MEHTHTQDTGWYNYGSSARYEESRILEAWCYTRRGGRRRSKLRVVQSRRIPDGRAAKVAQFQGIPSGVTQGTNSPEYSGDDPWDLVLYQEDGDSGNPSDDDPVLSGDDPIPSGSKGGWCV